MHWNTYWNSWKEKIWWLDTQITQKKPIQTTILNTFIKSDTSTQPLTPPKNHVKMFENQNWMPPLKHPNNKTTFDQQTSFTNVMYVCAQASIIPEPSAGWAMLQHLPREGSQSLLSLLAGSHKAVSHMWMVQVFIVTHLSFREAKPRVRGAYSLYTAEAVLKA